MGALKLVVADGIDQGARDQRCGANAETDSGQQLLHGGQIEARQSGLHPEWIERVDGAIEVLKFAVQYALAKYAGFILVEILQKVPNIGPRLAGDHEIEPGRVGPCAGRGYDLNGVAGLESGAQRCESAVDAAADAFIANVGVYRVGHVDGGRTPCQFHDRALGREHIDLVGKQVDLDVLKKLLGITRASLQFDYATQPVAGALVRAPGRAMAGFVQPMGGDAGLCHMIHFVGPDLHFEGHAKGSKQDRVQGLVAVGLGYRDVILEGPRHRFVQTVDHAQRAITGIDRVDDDAKRIDIVHLGQVQMFLPHLAIDAVKMLLAARDVGDQLLLTQMTLEAVLDLGDDFSAITADLLDEAFEYAVALGVERLEAELLKFQTDGIHAQALGDGGINIQCLACDAAALVRAQRVQGAHVV